MTQISLTDDALVALLESCDLPSTTVTRAPFEWDAGFVQRLLTTTPAVLVAFLGADDPDTKLTELNLDGKWGVYVATGWKGQDQEARRLGAGSGFDLLHRTAAALHNAVLKEPNGDRLPIVRVDGLRVLADSALDLANLWVAEISLVIELPLPLLEGDACFGPLDDFLKVRGPLVVEGPAADIPLAVDLEQ